jgi:hypothetical protein
MTRKNKKVQSKKMVKKIKTLGSNSLNFIQKNITPKIENLGKNVLDTSKEYIKVFKTAQTIKNIKNKLSGGKRKRNIKNKTKKNSCSWF